LELVRYAEHVADQRMGGPMMMGRGVNEHAEGLASAGAFCPNEECQLYAKVDHDNLIKFGKTKRGVQRYRCKRCQTTFAATRGTLFYRKHVPTKDILETLALLAEGVRISSLSRAKGFKEDTILRWLREAAGHAQAVEDVLLEDYEVSRAQVDGLWAYVGNKGQKGATKRARTAESSGAAR
jgi:transposase-like protein